MPFPARRSLLSCIRDAEKPKPLQCYHHFSLTEISCTLELTRGCFLNTLQQCSMALRIAVIELKPWEEVVSTGEVVGKDPRKMTQDEIKATGHQPMTLAAVIRARCLDCCAGSPNEVRYCVARKCPSWPYRMGTSPWRVKREMSAEEKENLTVRLAEARKNRRLPVKETP
jgi:hypothetical protein